MKPGPHTLLVYRTSVYPPLKRELEARDVRVVTLERLQDIASNTNVLACWVSFYDCMKHPFKFWRLRRHLKAANIPIFAWNRDAPHYLNRRPWRIALLDRLRQIDIYATHTLIDTRYQFADTFFYFPNAADTDSYSLAGPEETVLPSLRQPDHYEWDVSFFGGMDGSRYKEDQARADFFAALGVRLRESGIKFRFQEAQGMSLADQIRFIQKSRINLNFGARCEYQAPVASGLPERCFGIPAAGGFLLCDKRTHNKDHFVAGLNWAEFDGVDDCVVQIKHWLAHFDEARDVAERCYRHVVERETYAQRAETMINALTAWHGGKRGFLGDGNA